MIRQSDLQDRAQRPTSYSRTLREIHGTVNHSISALGLDGITGDQSFPGKIAMTPERLAANSYTTMKDSTKSGRKNWAIILYVAQVQLEVNTLRPERLTTISGPLLGYAH